MSCASHVFSFYVIEGRDFLFLPPNPWISLRDTGGLFFLLFITDCEILFMVLRSLTPVLSYEEKKKILMRDGRYGLKKVGRVKISMKIVGELLGAKLMVLQIFLLSSLAFAIYGEIWKTRRSGCVIAIEIFFEVQNVGHWEYS